MPFMRERLKQRRVDMGLTLQEVADTIGVEKPTVQRYESGKISRIDTLTVEKLATAVRCSPSFLMGWSEGARDKPVSESVSMTKPEKRIVEAFRSLNEEGQEKVVDYIDDLVQSGKYIKNNSYGMAVEVKQA